MMDGTSTIMSILPVASILSTSTLKPKALNIVLIISR